MVDQLLYKKACLTKLSLGQHNLRIFAELLKSNQQQPDNFLATDFICQPHHQLLIQLLEKIETHMQVHTNTERAEQQKLRLIISMPPRHGKSELISRLFLGWYMGRHPERDVMLCAYNAKLAEDFGQELRLMFLNPVYQQIFPDISLQNGQRSKADLGLIQGGKCRFVGINGSITGRGFDLGIIDDPIKNAAEAASPLKREKIWRFLTNDFMSRTHHNQSAIIMVMTRWHADDPVARLTDPRHDLYKPEIAEYWQVVNLPALAEKDDILGRQIGEALWPARFSCQQLRDRQKMDPAGFASLYQGQPTPEEGLVFTKSMLKIYHQLSDIPSSVHYYAALDLAVSTETNRDATCLLIGAIDADGILWIHPDSLWGRANSTDLIDQIMHLLARFRPMALFQEKGPLTRALSPFLHKAMQEQQIFIRDIFLPTTQDKRTRSSAVQGRMDQGKVRFPAQADWWVAAQQELLGFPRGKHDDFVDALSLFGLGLTHQINAQGLPENLPSVTTLSDLLANEEILSAATSTW